MRFADLDEVEESNDELTSVIQAWVKLKGG
jgi:hypothetical protein